MKKNANLNKTAVVDYLCSNYNKSMITHSSDEDFIHNVMMEVESNIFKTDDFK